MKEKRTKEVRFRVNDNELKIIKDKIEKFDFANISDYLRFVALNTTKVIAKND